MFRGEYHDSFPIDLMCKDNQLGYEMARNAKVNLLNDFFKRFIERENRMSISCYIKFLGEG